MSTIAYRWGIMAADTRAYAGGSNPIGQKSKIRNIAGALVGVSSPVPGTGEQLFHWLSKIVKPDGTFDFWDCKMRPELKTFSMLVVMPDHSCFFFDNSTYPSGPITAPYYAIGSGSEFALGAMAGGKDVVSAVRHACELDIWSAPPFNALKHDGRAWTVEK